MLAGEADFLLRIVATGDDMDADTPAGQLVERRLGFEHPRVRFVRRLCCDDSFAPERLIAPIRDLLEIVGRARVSHLMIQFG